MTMYNPAHPGEILREDIIPALDISVTDFAKRLGMGRVAISRVINEHAGISPQFALRLEEAGISNARFWLALQSNYDLSLERNRHRPAIEKLYINSSEQASSN